MQTRTGVHVCERVCVSLGDGVFLGSLWIVGVCESCQECGHLMFGRIKTQSKFSALSFFASCKLEIEKAAFLPH